MEAAERAERAAAAEEHRARHGRRPRRGRPLRAATDAARVQAAIAAAEEAMARADGARTVLAAVREALRPVVAADGRVRSGAEVGGDLETAASLLRAVGGRATEAATLLEHRAVGLSAYLTDLDQALAAPRAVLPPDTIAFVAGAWRHQRAFALHDAGEAWPAAPTAARWVGAALDGAVRASSMVENLNSALDPHRAAHRGLPWPLLAVWRVYRTHHVFARGKRAGHSPLDLAGLPAPHWLDALGYGRLPSPARPDFPACPPRTVTTLAA